MALRFYSLSILHSSTENHRLQELFINKSNLWIGVYCKSLFSTSNSTHDGKTVTCNGPLALYDDKVRRGELKSDEHQVNIVKELQHLHDQLVDYEPPSVPSQGIISKLLSFTSSKKATASKPDEAKKYTGSPMGLYLYGSVGCGKTMLMDFFHETSCVKHKKRIHFHQFMLDVHKRIHEVKKSIPSKNYNLNRSQPYDPIPPVARDISHDTSLLCFDEFQVTDIGDAMILRRLFSQLWQNGVVVVATSNRPPDDLYKNGLQRIHFLPFIPIAKANCKVLCLDSGIDYRRQLLPAEGVLYFIKSQHDAVYEMDKLYEDLVSKEKSTNEGPRTLHVMARDVVFQKTCGRILDTTFYEICMRPLGAVDYLEICNQFDTILLRDIPQMDLQRRSEARRFITLIDTLYDHKVRVVCSAEAPVDSLFALSNNLSDYDKHHKRVLIGDLDINVGDDNEMASIFSGEEELFAFERVMSRLTEMQTEDYWRLRDNVRRPREQMTQTAVS